MSFDSICAIVPYGACEKRLIVQERRIDANGGIMEIKVWRVPNPVRPATHGYKYSLFYGRPGVRLVGFDNEQGKGDHMHIAGTEKPYAFVNLEQLLDDFLDEVRKAGSI
jgi:hypothetical protein